MWKHYYLWKLQWGWNRKDLARQIIPCPWYNYLIKNTQGVKKERPRTKQALLKKMWNQIDRQCLLVLIGLKVLVMNSLQNIVISGAQGLLLLMGSNFLIKMTRLQNIRIKEQSFAAWSSLSKVLIPLTTGGLEHLK